MVRRQSKPRKDQMPTANASHPVWAVYDLLRTVRLNVLYYGRRLRTLERANFWMESTLAVFAPTSAVAGLWFWKTNSGKTVWLCCGVITAILSAIKPVLGLTKRIKGFEGVLSGYRLLEHDLRSIKISIEQKKKYDSSHQAEVKRTHDREKPLISQNIESFPIERIRKQCQIQVNSELPASCFFIPEE